MTLYRVVHRLSFDSGEMIEAGVVDSLEGIPPRVISILLEKGRISEVRAPPLRILPGWEKKAEALEALGIENVDQLVDANLDEVAEELGTSVKGLRVAARSARQWVDVQVQGGT